MDELIKKVTEKAGISTEQATSAVNTVVGFLKDKLPGGIGDQVANFLQGSGGGETPGGIAGDIKDKIGGILGK